MGTENEEELSPEYQVAFELIVIAGDSKAESMEAIEAAAEFNFDEAAKHLAAADEKMVEAHRIQTDLLENEANGKPAKVNIVLVHAQDHLTTAIIMRDQAELFIKLYRTIQSLSQK